MMSDFEVYIPDESSMHDFLVAFPGPEDTPYLGGIWKVHVTLPKEYPFKSPSIGFENRMFHPNVDEMSGSVCLDVINQTWSPMFDLVNIFTLFIPQLLSYPNPTDPLNGEAAALLMRDPEAYAARIRDCVRLYASDPVHLDGTPVIVASSNTNTNTNPNTIANADANANANSASSGSGSGSDGSGSGSAAGGSSTGGSSAAVGGGAGSGGGVGGAAAGRGASAVVTFLGGASSAIVDAGGGSSGGRSNSIGSDTSGISVSSTGLSGSSFDSESASSSAEEDKPPAMTTVEAATAATAATGGNYDANGNHPAGDGNNGYENGGNKAQGGNDIIMGGGDNKAEGVKRRDLAEVNVGGNGCRSSSSSGSLMEMDLDETASNVSALSDVDG